MDLRCYGHVSVRHNKKLTLSLPDLDGFQHEWDVDADLPWHAVTPVLPGTNHPDVLDAALVEAITTHAVPPSAAKDRRIAVSIIAFLYLYMSLAVDEQR